MSNMPSKQKDLALAKGKISGNSGVSKRGKVVKRNGINYQFESNSNTKTIGSK